MDLGSGHCGLVGNGVTIGTVRAPGDGDFGLFESQPRFPIRLPLSVSTKAIFLSYASQDAEAARRICDAMRAVGLDVWFDQSDLRGGDAWDAAIRKQVKECALFVPIISANTEAREEGYFRREWNLAVHRTLDMADGRAFLLPVAIDGTSEVLARVPEKFREVQWTRLPAGTGAEMFAERAKQLLSGGPTSSATVPILGTGSPRSLRGTGRRWVAAGVLVVGLAGTAVWTLQPKVQRASEPEAPVSVAILPFGAPPDSPADQPFAEALTRDVAVRLGRSHWLSVASPSSVLEDRGKAKDPASLGRELKVRYVVSGEVRKVGEKLAVTTYLIVSENGGFAWNDRLEIAARSVEDESLLAPRLAGRLGNALFEAEMHRAATRPVQDSAWDLVLHGVAAFRSGSDFKSGHLASLKFFDEALRVNPNFMPALTWKAAMINDLIDDDVWKNGALPDSRIEEMNKITALAVAIDANSAIAWYLRSEALLWMGRLDEAWAANEKEAGLAPYSSLNLSMRAGILLAKDRPDEALQVAKQASTMDFSGSGVEGAAMRTLCWCSMMLGQYSEAARACERSAVKDNYWGDQVWLAAAYAQQGEMAKAALAKAALLKERPDFSIQRQKVIDAALASPGYIQRAEAHLYAGMRKAGIPEK